MVTQAPGGAGQNPAYRPTHHRTQSRNGDLHPRGPDLSESCPPRRTARRARAELRLMVRARLIRWLCPGTGSGDIRNCSSDLSLGGRSLSAPSVSCRGRSTSPCQQRAHRRALSPNGSHLKSRRFIPPTTSRNSEPHQRDRAFRASTSTFCEAGTATCAPRASCTPMIPHVFVAKSTHG